MWHLFMRCTWPSACVCAPVRVRSVWPVRSVPPRGAPRPRARARPGPRAHAPSRRRVGARRAARSYSTSAVPSQHGFMPGFIHTLIPTVHSHAASTRITVDYPNPTLTLNPGGSMISRRTRTGHCGLASGAVAAGVGEPAGFGFGLGLGST